MNFRSLEIRLTFRLFLLLLSLTCLSWFIANSHSYSVILLILFLAIVQTLELWRLLTLNNRLLTRFFTAIKYDDYNQRFNQGEMGKSFEELSLSMNYLIEKLQQSKQLLEQQSLYLQTILQHIETAVIVYDRQGNISLINRAANRLLQNNAIKNIQQLSSDYPELSKSLTNIRSGQRNLCSCNIYNRPHQLLVDMVEAKIENEPVYIAAIQDIQSELDEKELKAWQDITKVLTHEISNSITPITSLANSCSHILESAPDAEDLVDLTEAIATIERRGENLVQFIANYRKLTKVPKLNSKRTSVNELLEHIARLFKDELSKNNILLESIFDEAEIFAVIDPVLVEQVLVNLFNNAIAALKATEEPVIRLKLETDKGKIKISVEDNGKGILDEAKQRIFVPFYSTKPNGSGIGLSLSRLIMQLHNGTIAVQSKLEEGSRFTLTF